MRELDQHASPSPKSPQPQAGAEAGRPVAVSSWKPSLTVILLNPATGSEWDWICDLLSPFELEIITAPDGSVVRPGALYAYYNDSPIAFPSGFEEALRDLPGCGLLHMGDEYLRGNYRIYSSFDYVIRNLPSPILSGPGVFDIPIGQSNGMPELRSTPASQRKWVWSFAGGRRQSRIAMANTFKRITPHLLSLPDTSRGEKHISRGEFLQAIADSMFVPCVEGNVMIETMRPYEALKYGAIPLLPRRPFADPYRELLGEHPLPTFETWSAAAAFVAEIKDNGPALDRLQTEVTDWWRSARRTWAERTREFILMGRAGAHRDALASRFGNHKEGATWQAARLWDMMRQQSSGQIQARLDSVPKKLIGRLTGAGAKYPKGEWTLALHSDTDRSADAGRSGESSKTP